MSAPFKALARIGWTKAATSAPTREGRRLMVMRATDLDGIFVIIGDGDDGFLCILWTL
jgi:hypothetical protein